MKKYIALISGGDYVEYSEEDFNNLKNVTIYREGEKDIIAKKLLITNGDGISYVVFYPIKDFKIIEEQK